MLQKYFNKIFYSEYKWIIYIIGIFLIIYYDKFSYNKIILILWSLSFITIIWMMIIIIRKYYINEVIKFNQFILKNLSIFIKLRKVFINLPLIIRIILSLYIFIDIFFIKILFLHTRKHNFFYFLRLLIYYNIIIWITMPFYLIVEFYVGILIFLENPINIYKYLELRLHYIIMVIIVSLLLNMQWINIIIIFWIVDEIVTVYYYWWLNYKELKLSSELNWNNKDIILRGAFYNAGIYYNKVISELREIESYRNKIILLFQGIENIEEINFKMVKKFKKLYEDFFNNYYINFIEMKYVGWEYYNSINDEGFILRFVNNYIIGAEMENENFKRHIKNLTIEELINEEINDKFYKYMYNLIYNMVKILKENEELLNEFLKLREKYDLRSREDFKKYKDVEEFFKKINKKKLD